MNERKKISRKVISFVLSLLMVLSCFSGMGLTAYATSLTIDDLVTAVGTSTFNYSSSDAYTVKVVEGKLMNVNPWASDEARDLTYNSSDGKYHLKFGIYDNDWYIDIDSNNYITSFMFDNGGTYGSYSGKSQYALNLSAPAATAYAAYVPTEADDATALAAKVVKFNGYDWYLIEDNSTSETEGTVTLFAKDTIGSSRFDNSNNVYSGSMVKSYLDNLTAEGGAFADVADAIVPTDLEDVTVTGAKLWLLSKDEVITTYKLSTALNKCSNDWWLRTPATSSYLIYVNGESGSVVNAGNFHMNTYGVRPALNLDLSKVEFNSETNTFAVKPPVIEYRLWVGDVQVTSANMDDVLGDKDSGATVTFTPAATGENPTPATLTLKGATVTDYSAGVSVKYGVNDTLVINLEGDNTIGSDSDDGLYTGLETRGSLIIQGNGKLAVKGRYHGIMSDGDITIESGEITASALNSGIESGNEKEITLNGGKVTAKGNTGIVGYGGVTIAGADVNAEGKNYAIFTADKDITISAGTVNATATGADTWQKALNGTVKNSIYGTGWTDSAGTEGKTAIATSTTGQDLSDYKKVIFVSHIHDFTYSADGATLTATCSADGCDLTDNKVSFTIIAENATYDSNTHGATVDFTAWEAAGLPPAPAVQYTGRGTTTYNSTTAPTNAGTYKASITLGKGTNAKIASVDYEIAKADPTYEAPKGIYATYGDTLADVALPTGWAWVDDTTSVGDAGKKTFKANFTPADTTNYNVVENVDVTVKVNPADITPTVTLDGWTYGNEANTPSVTGNAGNGDVAYTYAKKGSDEFSSDVPAEAGDYTVKAVIAETANYNGGEATADFIIAKADITPTVTLDGWTYGDEANLPTVTGNTGNGEVTYLYKEKGASDMSCTDVVPTQAGEYTVKALINETANYNGGEATADFTIAKAKVTITAEDKTSKREAALKELTYKVDGKILDGDDLGIKVTSDVKAAVAGKYDIKVAYTEKANYDVTVVNGTYTVTDRITATEKTAGKNKINSAAKATASKKGVTVKLGKVANAEKYEIYAAYCGKNNKYKKIKTVKGNINSFDITKLGGKKLNTSKCLKVYVVAYRKVNGKYEKITKSLTMHIAGKTNKHTNAKAIKVKKSSYTLKVNKTATIKPTLVLQKKNKKAVEHVAKFRYQSTNKAVATVDKNGKIKAVGKGTCTIYIFANNGKLKSIKVTVK